MSTKKKLLQAAAGSAGGAGLDIDDVFSIDLWTSDGSSTQTITNNIDLSSEGGLVWIKDRSTAKPHVLVDTARISGTTDNYLMSDSTNAQTAHSNEFGNFTSTGYTLPRNTEAGYTNTNTGRDYVGWTFRKAPKFFDVVTFSGNSTARTISHNLGADVGFMVVKRTSGAGTNWMCFHRSVGATKGALLNGTNAFSTDSTTWNDTAPTSSVFSLGTDGNVNKTGHDYVAYLFAHNDSDGDFGPDADQDIIKCGSYTGNETNPNSINLGFEPQWLMVKAVSKSQNWFIVDVMRGITTGGDEALLSPNLTDAESDNNYFSVTPTGFNVENSGTFINETGQTYIYMAIRRGSLAEPENATDVFAISDRKNQIPSFPSGFPVDFVIGARTINGADNNEIKTRLITGYLRANTTDAEVSTANQIANFAHNDGFFNFSGANANQYCWMWKRAPGYFDVCCYTGNGTAGRTVSHNLGVVPEMMWIKRRDTTGSWAVFHKDLNTTSGEKLNLNSTSVASVNTAFFNSTVPTSSVFTVGTSNNTNASSGTYVAYLFATLAGISKVGSYTGTGTAGLNVDCGFSNGARFVLIKKATGTASYWAVFDSVRGIVSGNDPFLRLNDTTAETTSIDAIDPYSAGFTVATDFSFLNNSGDTYIFYAIA